MARIEAWRDSGMILSKPGCLKVLELCLPGNPSLGRNNVCCTPVTFSVNSTSIAFKVDHSILNVICIDYIRQIDVFSSGAVLLAGYRSTNLDLRQAIFSTEDAKGFQGVPAKPLRFQSLEQNAYNYESQPIG